MVINFFGSILVTGVTRIWEYGKSRKVTVKSGGKNPKSTLSTKIRKKNPKSVLSTLATHRDIYALCIFEAFVINISGFANLRCTHYRRGSPLRCSLVAWMAQPTPGKGRTAAIWTTGRAVVATRTCA